MLTIWGRTNSVNVKKVLWCAEELGLTYERKEAGGLFGLVDEPSFRALNPNGLVPLIEDQQRDLIPFPLPMLSERSPKRLLGHHA